MIGDFTLRSLILLAASIEALSEAAFAIWDAVSDLRRQRHHAADRLSAAGLVTED